MKITLHDNQDIQTTSEGYKFFKVDQCRYDVVSTSCACWAYFITAHAFRFPMSNKYPKLINWPIYLSNVCLITCFKYPCWLIKWDFDLSLRLHPYFEYASSKGSIKYSHSRSMSLRCSTIRYVPCTTMLVQTNITRVNDNVLWCMLSDP